MSDYGCGRNLRHLLLLRAIFAKRDRALVESTTGTPTRGIWGGDGERRCARERETEREKGMGDGRERERLEQSTENSARERGKRNRWTVKDKMIRERRKCKARKERQRGGRNREGNRCERDLRERG